MNIFWWKNNMFYDNKITIKWVNNQDKFNDYLDEFNDYLDELTFEVMQLMKI